MWYGYFAGDKKNTLSDKSQKSREISIKNLEKVQKSHLKILASIPLPYTNINYIIHYLEYIFHY
jgi:hypothetical protein